MSIVLSSIVTEYIPFPYFTRTTSETLYGNQSNHGVLWRGTAPNQDSRGIRPRGVNRIHQAQAEPWGSSIAYALSRKLIPGVHIVWTDQVKEGLEQCWSSEPIRLLIKQKGLWPLSASYIFAIVNQRWRSNTTRLDNDSPVAWAVALVACRARSVLLVRSLSEAASRPASSLASILAWKT